MKSKKSTQEIVTLSLFEYDFLNTILSKIGMNWKKKHALLKRILFFLAITWLPILVLCYFQGAVIGSTKKESFLLDFAAYAQFFIAIPSMILAERFLIAIFKTTANYFVESGIISLPESGDYYKLITRINNLGAMKWFEYSIGLIAFMISISWIYQESHDGISTWHALLTSGSEKITYAGIWAGFIAVPLYLFFLFRWIIKVILWSWYLWKVSRLHLTINALHPDRAAGLGFIGEAQSAFSILLFSAGSSIAGTVIYKIVVSEIPVNTFTVWGPILALVILGPIIFMLPLLSFTDKLYWAKEHAKYEFGVFSNKYTSEFDRNWIEKKSLSNSIYLKDFDIQSLASLTTNYEAIHSTRIVPFDLKSMLQLTASAFAPIVPLISSMFPQIETWIKMLF